MSDIKQSNLNKKIKSGKSSKSMVRKSEFIKVGAQHHFNKILNNKGRFF